MITIDFNKAKELTKNRLRAERAPLFEQLDVAFIRAIEVNDVAKMEEVKAEKQRLRDITQLVAPCTTLDELKALSVN